MSSSTSKSRLEAMDACGIEYSILSLNAPAVKSCIDTNAVIELARRSNDTLAEHVARNPPRFGGFAALPLQDPEASSRELIRAVRELGFVGALVNGFSNIGSDQNATYYDLPQCRQF